MSAENNQHPGRVDIRRPRCLRTWDFARLDRLLRHFKSTSSASPDVGPPAVRGHQGPVGAAAVEEVLGPVRKRESTNVSVRPAGWLLGQVAASPLAEPTHQACSW
jgi:hypothetical protein